MKLVMMWCWLVLSVISLKAATVERDQLELLVKRFYEAQYEGDAKKLEETMAHSAIGGGEFDDRLELDDQRLEALPKADWNW